MATTSPLRQRMIQDMPLAGDAAILHLRGQKFGRHFGRSPDRLGIEDVRAYQLHLIAQKRSWSHINQTACALRFFYGVTLGRQEAFERIVTLRKPEKLPRVLSPEEIARLLEAVVLEGSASRPVAVSRSGVRRACRRGRIAGRLSGRARQGEGEQNAAPDGRRFFEGLQARREGLPI